MAGGAELFSLNYIKESDIMVGTILGANLDKAEANQIFQFYNDEISKHPAYADFILDARKAVVVTNSAIGVLMKGLETMKRGKAYGILVMTEKLLQEVMLQFPEMFDFYAVFHTIEDAVAYIKKSRSGG